MFEKVTMCVYGQSFSSVEAHTLVENAQIDYPLDKLRMYYSRIIKF